MLRRIAPQGGIAGVTLYFEGAAVTVPAGTTVAAALLQAGAASFRDTAVTGSPRGPYCMMGVCFDCLVEIDGQPNRQACLTVALNGMRVERQRGAALLDPKAGEGA
ncbi:MAG: sarcosine oxidase [Rhodospirillales bacterium CG15_BIG_FIL_POST_REV_8_21_14_020_66_15]|nr:MAG: sarcosine oxidase [Rhodospirillales bacterium CG15_BIG_FIL_POST_REV_8_21_14_020_66_15]